MRERHLLSLFRHWVIFAVLILLLILLLAHPDKLLHWVSLTAIFWQTGSSSGDLIAVLVRTLGLRLSGPRSGVCLDTETRPGRPGQEPGAASRAGACRVWVWVRPGRHTLGLLPHHHQSCPYSFLSVFRNSSITSVLDWLDRMVTRWQSMNASVSIPDVLNCHRYFSPA